MTLRMLPDGSGVGAPGAVFEGLDAEGVGDGVEVDAAPADPASATARPDATSAPVPAAMAM